jgi:hypothetical protein
MDAATIIDKIVTPLGAGLGAFIGLRMLPQTKGRPVLQAIGIAACVAAIMFAIKFFATT